jgi:hypothetical protein
MKGRKEGQKDGKRDGKKRKNVFKSRKPSTFSMR